MNRVYQFFYLAKTFLLLSLFFYIISFFVGCCTYRLASDIHINPDDKFHLKTKMSKQEGEKRLVKIAELEVLEEFWIHSEGVWYEVGEQAKPTQVTYNALKLYDISMFNKELFQYHIHTTGNIKINYNKFKDQLNLPDNNHILKNYLRATQIWLIAPSANDVVNFYDSVRMVSIQKINMRYFIASEYGIVEVELNGIDKRNIIEESMRMSMRMNEAIDTLEENNVEKILQYIGNDKIILSIRRTGNERSTLRVEPW